MGKKKYITKPKPKTPKETIHEDYYPAPNKFEKEPDEKLFIKILLNYSVDNKSWPCRAMREQSGVPIERQKVLAFEYGWIFVHREETERFVFWTDL